MISSFSHFLHQILHLPDYQYDLASLMGKESACSVGDLGSIPGLGRSPGEGNCNPIQYSCLENPMDSPWGRRVRHD